MSYYYFVAIPIPSGEGQNPQPPTQTVGTTVCRNTYTFW
jgi:hypothetical protein